MANTDYEKRGSGRITPSASLGSTVAEDGLTLLLNGYTASGNTQPTVGMGAMVEGEIMRVTSVDMPNIGVARGCADTIPARHLFGAKVWLFTTEMGSDNREYMATETVSVKVLMHSSASTMDVKNAPPRKLVFNQRFARPYPPGLVQVNGDPFHGMHIFAPDFALTWAHRDRILQDDTLQGHEVGNIGPEPGTTYTIKVYKASDNSLVRTEAAIATNEWAYSLADAVTDIGENLDAYLTLESVREGFTSWQKYKINFKVTDTPLGGWGKAWGSSFGKI